MQAGCGGRWSRLTPVAMCLWWGGLKRHPRSWDASAWGEDVTAV